MNITAVRYRTMRNVLRTFSATVPPQGHHTNTQWGRARSVKIPVAAALSRGAHSTKERSLITLNTLHERPTLHWMHMHIGIAVIWTSHQWVWHTHDLCQLSLQERQQGIVDEVRFGLVCVHRGTHSPSTCTHVYSTDPHIYK